jgi:hypothetical protein
MAFVAKGAEVIRGPQNQPIADKGRRCQGHFAKVVGIESFVLLAGPNNNVCRLRSDKRSCRRIPTAATLDLGANVVRNSASPRVDFSVCARNETRTRTLQIATSSQSYTAVSSP